MRNQFDRQLNTLNGELIQMGHMVEQAIEHAIEAMVHQDAEKARKNMEFDSEVDQQEKDIETLCMKLLMKQQPVARDLRLKQMSQECMLMVMKGLEAFVAKDIEMAKKVIARDDVIDAMFDDTKKEVIKLIQNNGAGAEVATDLLMVAKYFERIGDHATNIAEWVIFSINGTHPTINPEPVL